MAEEGDLLRVRPGSAVWREVDGETVLLDLETSTYLGLNASATALWPALVEGTDRDALVEVLCRTYDLDQDTAARDVDAFLQLCRERNLLEA